MRGERTPCRSRIGSLQLERRDVYVCETGKDTCELGGVRRVKVDDLPSGKYLRSCWELTCQTPKTATSRLTSLSEVPDPGYQVTRSEVFRKSR